MRDYLPKPLVISYHNKEYQLSGIKWFEDGRVYFDYITTVIRFGDKFFESETLDFIKGLNLVGAYVDVGASFGNHTIFFAGECPSTEVFAFEPMPVSFTALQRSIESNSLMTPIHAFQLGMSWTPESARISIVDESNVGKSEVSIDGDYPAFLSTLDGFLGPKSDVAVLKIDVEGMERDVLDGSKRLIKISRPVIIAEAWPANRIALKKYLDQMDYEVIFTDDDGMTMVFAPKESAVYEENVGKWPKRYA